MNKQNIKVMVGLSGGVDSAVALYLLQKEGYNVTAGFMRNWDALANNDIDGNPTLLDPSCPQEVDYDDAQKVADKLGVKLLRVDFVKEYWDDVFLHFIHEYENGRTPNPDIFCNKYIKFAAFLKWAKNQGFDYIATGHYAKKSIDTNGLAILEVSRDANKDQTYFLSQLNQQQLSASLFPLGDLVKEDVRKIAKELDLDVATKKDSTGICFIGERHFRLFLKNYIPMKDGVIKSVHDNRVIGKHTGVFYYTIGQRRGLGIGGIRGQSDNNRWYVAKKDVANNVLYVSNDESDEHLKSDMITMSEVNFNHHPLVDGEQIMVKFRYRQKSVPAVYFKLEDGTGKLVFPRPYLAVTPGQAVVFYQNTVCLGGAIIEDTYYLGQKTN